MLNLIVDPMRLWWYAILIIHCQMKHDHHKAGQMYAILDLFVFQFIHFNPWHFFQVTFNPINREHLLSNNTYSSTDQSGNNDTTNSIYTSSSSTTSNSNQSEFFDKNTRIHPYVDFSEFYQNIEVARNNGTLPSILQFNWFFWKSVFFCIYTNWLNFFFTVIHVFIVYCYWFYALD